MRIEIDQAARVPQDLSHIGLSQAEIAGLLHASQRLGYFRLDIATGLIFLSAEACRILQTEKTDGPVGLTDIVRRLCVEDVELLTSTFETAAWLKTGFDLICRIQQENASARFIRVVGRFRQDECGEGDIAGLVYELFECMNVVGLCEA